MTILTYSPGSEDAPHSVPRRINGVVGDGSPPPVARRITLFCGEDAERCIAIEDAREGQPGGRAARLPNEAPTCCVREFAERGLVVLFSVAYNCTLTGAEEI